MRRGRLGATYVLPLRWASGGPVAELRDYLRGLAELVEEVILVDGSPPPAFARHASAFGPFARHLAPHPDLRFTMGKVNGVITGVREARCERVVIADDDVRYGDAELARVVAALGEADLVRPQNYFRPLPWHARLDTGRSLLNRVFSGDPRWPAADFPGTLAVRRSAFLAAGAYDGDVMFENLELIRTVAAAGGTVASPLDLYVERRPPGTRHFLSQRVRQAYDDFALPLRLAAFLAVVPAAALALARGRHRRLAAAAAVPAVLAETGRRRAGGAAVFPASASLLAPLWVLERGISAWLAVYARLARRGVAYGEGRIARAASPMRELRRRQREPGSRSLGERKPIAL